MKNHNNNYDVNPYLFIKAIKLILNEQKLLASKLIIKQLCNFIIYA